MKCCSFLKKHVRYLILVSFLSTKTYFDVRRTILGLVVKQAGIEIDAQIDDDEGEALQIKQKTKMTVKQ